MRTITKILATLFATCSIAAAADLVPVVVANVSTGTTAVTANTPYLTYEIDAIYINVDWVDAAQTCVVSIVTADATTSPLYELIWTNAAITSDTVIRPRVTTFVDSAGTAYTNAVAGGLEKYSLVSQKLKFSAHSCSTSNQGIRVDFKLK